jgi:hypothetical protein
VARIAEFIAEAPPRLVEDGPASGLAQRLERKQLRIEAVRDRLAAAEFRASRCVVGWITPT